jgi:hypothetical protein
MARMTWELQPYSSSYRSSRSQLGSGLRADLATVGAIVNDTKIIYRARHGPEVCAKKGPREGLQAHH